MAERGTYALVSSARGRGLLRDFERWGYDEKGWSRSTRERYFRRVIAADAWLRRNRGSRGLRWASTDDLRAHLFSVSSSQRNRNHVRQSLIAFGEFLVARKLRKENFAAALPRLKEPRLLPRPLSLADAHRVWSAALTLGGIHPPLVGVMLWAGLRKTEARTLRQVDIIDDYIRVLGKGSKERVVPIHPELGRVLRAWKPPDPEWLFPSTRFPGAPISDTAFRGLCATVSHEAGVYFHPHMLRHTFATRLVDVGVDVRRVQELMGHADIRTTGIYLGVSPGRLRESIVALDFNLEGDAEIVPLRGSEMPQDARTGVRGHPAPQRAPEGK